MSDEPSFSPWPCFTSEEAGAVQRVLLSNKVNYWTGDEGRQFEKEFAFFSGTKHAIAVANGTVAIDLALKALGVKTGDEVIVTPRSFIASASCIVNSGAKPVFADVDPDSQNITAETIEPLITPATKAIICVHLAGWPCEMDAIVRLAEVYGLDVIEDCAQAHGATYRGHSVGSFGTIGAFSFCQDKIMTTGGEGGMVTTDNPTVWSKMWSYKDHGKSWEAVYDLQHPPGFRWLHESFGTNWRMTEMQSAIGRIQLGRMRDWHAKRKENAAAITDAVINCKALRVPQVPPHIEHAWYKYYVFVQPEMLLRKWSRDRIIHEISELGVPCFSGSCPEVYLEKAFENAGMKPANRLPIARQLGETSLMFLVHPTLTNTEISQTCEVLNSVMKRAIA